MSWIRTNFWPWIALTLVAGLARASAWWVIDPAPQARASAHHEHAFIAASLARGNGFRFNFYGANEEGEPTSQQAPFVPTLLAACYRVGGIESPTAFRLMLGLQVVASIATALVLAATANDLFGASTHFASSASQADSRESGRAASRSNATVSTDADRSCLAGGAVGMLAALYPPMVISSLHVQALAWNLLWLSLLLWGTARRLRTKPFGSAIVALAGILGVLTDPILGGVVVALWVGLIIDPRGLRHREAVLLVGAIALGVSPWIIRNYLVHRRFVPIKNSLPYVFWQGNNPQSMGTDKLLVRAEDAEVVGGWSGINDLHRAVRSARQRAVSVDSTLPPETILRLRSLPREIDRMDLFSELSCNELRQRPWSYPGHCLQRLGHWLWFDPTNPRSLAWPYRASYLSILALALLSLGPIVRTLGRSWPLLASAGALTLTHVLVITSARFRIPFEMLLLFPAALTLDRLFKTFVSRQRTKP